MSARSRAPGREWLADRISEGLTDQQMADRWLEETGERLSRQTINRVVRLHELRTPLERYDDVIPWRVKEEHANHYYHRLLYAEARLRRGKLESEKWITSLKNFKAKLRQLDAVVAYNPDSREGFALVKRKPGEELITTRGTAQLRRIEVDDY